jgi:hypothetical protein
VDVTEMPHFDNMDRALLPFSTFELNRLHGSAPFATSNGLFGFLTDANMQGGLQGATICLFQGCRAPFILQGGPERYTLVGPCFLSPYIDVRPTKPFEDLIVLV